MATHRITVGFTDDENAVLTEVSETLCCTKQDVIKQAIRNKEAGIIPIVETYWKKKETEHFRENLECSVDQSTLRLLQNFGRQLERQTQVLKSVEKKLDSILKYITSDRRISYSNRTEKILSLLDQIYAEDAYLLEKQQKIEKAHIELVDDLQHVEFRLKRVF